MSEKPDDKPDTEKPEPVVKITNDEKVEVNEVVNKKLTEMSKEAKTRKKRKLQKPETSKDTGASSTSVSTLTNNQIYMLLAVVGVIIAGASLYYQRKSVVKDEKPKVEQEPIKEHDHGPVPVVVDLTEQTPGMYSF